ncbi:MAG: hypothetical protein QOJ04_6832 [Caballeronia sp.]|jgi:organic radical activating enzyme|nr:hypothetical protein [Caballeronia sp.]
MFQSPVVDIYVTGACNLACDYCFGEIDTKAGMARDTFLAALRFAHFVGASHVEFCGGEPLLYRDLDWAVERSRSEGFALILRTNGHLVKPRASYLAENFAAIGISVDGDAEANDRLRPLKGRRPLSPEDKLQLPLSAVLQIKAANPSVKAILASVATAQNVQGLRTLAELLVERTLPIDLWKIHQFVANNFRAIRNESQFRLANTAFADLERDLLSIVQGSFPISCRRADEVDGSCLVINRDGDVLVGATRRGNIMRDDIAEIAAGLANASSAISRNKIATYGAGVREARP